MAAGTLEGGWTWAASMDETHPSGLQLALHHHQAQSGPGLVFRQSRQRLLLDHVPRDHLLRCVDRVLDPSELREHLVPSTATPAAPRSIPS